MSKNGMDARLPKGGAGGHNWGNLSREQYLEEAASYDEQEDFVEEGREYSRSQCCGAIYSPHLPR